MLEKGTKKETPRERVELSASRLTVSVNLISRMLGIILITCNLRRASQLRHRGMVVVEWALLIQSYIP